MCPQIISGTNSDLTSTVSELIRDLLRDNWPTSGFDPVNTDIDFGISTWNNYGDIDIHVNADKSVSTPMTLGWTRSAVLDTVAIHLYVRANQTEIPANAGNTQRKIEEIIKDNAANLGQGIISLRWEGWGPIVIDNNLKEVWHAIGKATAMYVKVKV
jgi:hypothetical protein